VVEVAGLLAVALDPGELSDRRAVARAIAGDHEAFGAVARRHTRGLVSLCGRLVGDTRVGEELAQEALARAFARLATFRGECSFRHWLYRIAVNGCRDFQKAGGRAEECATLTGDELWAESDPERDAGTREALAALGRALASLPSAYREAFTLFHLENLCYDEIALITGVRVNALKVRVHRARLRLRSLLESA
jgi:RNA polymerase sigma-70 factor (ECF subfamily)